MKNTDLMIGDWVHWQDHPTDAYQWANFQVTEMGADSIKTDFCGDEFFYDELEPIELTPDILKRSGLELEDEWWSWRRLGVPTGNLYVSVAFRGDDVAVYDVEIMGYHNAHICHHLNYVHELQHLFRLFGIDIELKIE